MLSGRHPNQVEPRPDTAAHSYLQHRNPSIECALSLRKKHDERDARRQWERQQMGPGAMNLSSPGGGYQPGAGQAAIPRSPGVYADGHIPHITSMTTAVPGSYLHVPPANSPSASSWSPGHPPGSYFSTPPRRDSNRPAPHYAAPSRADSGRPESYFSTPSRANSARTRSSFATPSRVDSSHPVSTNTLQVDNSGQSLGSSPTTQQVDDTSQAQVALQSIQTQLMDNADQPEAFLSSLQPQVVDNADQAQTALPTTQRQQVGIDSLLRDVLSYIETQQVDNTGQPQAAHPSVQTQQMDDVGPSVATSQPMPQVDDIDGLLDATQILPRVDLSGRLVASFAATRQAGNPIQTLGATIAIPQADNTGQIPDALTSTQPGQLTAVPNESTSLVRRVDRLLLLITESTEAFAGASARHLAELENLKSELVSRKL